MYLHGTLPHIFSHFKKQREHKEKKLNSLNWEKKIMLHISLMVPGARVSLIMGKSIAWEGKSTLGEITVFFLEGMCIKPVVHASHIVPTNTSYPQPWRTLEVKQGWYPSKVLEMSAESSGLMLLHSMGLPLTVQDRTLLLTIKLAESVANSMTSTQYDCDLFATLQWPFQGMCTLWDCSLAPTLTEQLVRAISRQWG